MTSILNQFKKNVLNRRKNRIPRTELWIGTKIFEEQSLADTLENHLRIADRLGHDLVCLPVSDAAFEKPDLGYRYFGCRDIKHAAKNFDRPILALIDGPFQEMTTQMGLMQVLTQWIQDKPKIADTYRKKSENALQLMARILEYPVAGIVITDDFASDTGPMVAPEDIKTLFTPFYKKAVKLANQNGRPLFMHSCGKLNRLVSVITSWQINGLCAVQSDPNDLLNLYNTFGRSILIMAGIELDMLASDPLRDDALKQLKTIALTLGPNDLILCSSCGIYESSNVARLKKIYQAIDLHSNM